MQTMKLTITIPFLVVEDLTEAAKLILASENLAKSTALGVASIVGEGALNLMGRAKAMGVSVDITSTTSEVVHIGPTPQSDVEAWRKSHERLGVPAEVLHEILVRDAKGADAKLRDAPAQGADDPDHDQSRADADAVLARVFGAGAVH